MDRGDFTREELVLLVQRMSMMPLNASKPQIYLRQIIAQIAEVLADLIKPKAPYVDERPIRLCFGDRMLIEGTRYQVVASDNGILVLQQIGDIASIAYPAKLAGDGG